jgi:NAD(P)-dependent dehydrogenase (short-subunit alcohol dehydrogenase family)
MPNSDVVLITGGCRGIGLDVTKKFISFGYKVYVLDLNFDNFELKGNSLVEAVQYDLSDIGGIPKLISEIPPVDILINNAGILFGCNYESYTQDKIDKMLKINLQAPVALITEVSKNMISKGRGRIVNNASIAGEIGHPDVWYGITKAGVLNFTKSFAQLLGSKGIVINSVAPGPVETEMLSSIPQVRREYVIKNVYLGRYAYSKEVSDTIHWLATDCPEYINGTCIDINNGAFPR